MLSVWDFDGIYFHYVTLQICAVHLSLDAI